MRRFLSLFIIFLCTLGLIINTAEAGRFGGGRSFGVHRSISSFSRSPTQRTSRPSIQTNKWLGALTGFALGSLIASLFMGHGLGMLMWLMLGVALLVVFNLFRKKISIASQAANYAAYSSSNFVPDFPSSSRHNEYQKTNYSIYPMDFDTDAFIRDAKVCFLRLQTAYDRKNLNDLGDFTTPQVFAEIQIQLQERGEAENQTEVVSLSAELLDVANEQQPAIRSSPLQITSVRFSGLIRENSDKLSTSFNEIWHFQKGVSDSRWLVAGIQQAVNLN
jgi:predicted lipid-binding transport protein (Tim44 family)